MAIDNTIILNIVSQLTIKGVTLGKQPPFYVKPFWGN